MKLRCDWAFSLEQWVIELKVVHVDFFIIHFPYYYYLTTYSLFECFSVNCLMQGVQGIISNFKWTASAWCCQCIGLTWDCTLIICFRHKVISWRTTSAHKPLFLAEWSKEMYLQTYILTSYCRWAHTLASVKFLWFFLQFEFLIAVTDETFWIKTINYM